MAQNDYPRTRKQYIKEARKMMNMTPASAREWQRSEAYQEYRHYRDEQKYAGYTGNVVDRAIRVYNGSASKQEAEKVYSYLNRAKGTEGGEQKFGSGSKAVSANSAAKRNWLYCPTGLYAD